MAAAVGNSITGHFARLVPAVPLDDVDVAGHHVEPLHARYHAGERGFVASKGVELAGGLAAIGEGCVVPPRWVGVAAELDRVTRRSASVAASDVDRHYPVVPVRRVCDPVVDPDVVDRVAGCVELEAAHAVRLRGVLDVDDVVAAASRQRIDMIVVDEDVVHPVLDDPVQLIDIMPTLLPLLGVEAPYKLQGVDLMRVLGGRGLPRDRLRVAENKGGVGLLRGPWKLIYYEDDRRPAELFHVGDDPQELHSVLQQHPEIAESLRADYARLQERSARLARRFKITEDSRRLNPKAERDLRALGYIQ